MSGRFLCSTGASVQPSRLWPFLLLTLLRASAASADPASRDPAPRDDFAGRYRAYQRCVADAQSALGRGTYPEAVELYTEALAQSPFVAAHYYARGLALYKLGKSAEALADFERTLVLDPRYAPAYIYRGLCRLSRGEHELALADYRTALEASPQDPTVHNNLAWLHATAPDGKVRDGRKALEHARKAVDLSHGTDPEVLDTLARALCVNESWKEAVETESKALMLDPENEKLKKSLRVYQQAFDAGGGPCHANQEP